MTNIIIEKQSDGDFRVKLQSDDPWTFQLCLDSLKLFIKPPLRRYDPATKSWIVVGPDYKDFYSWVDYCCTTFFAQIKRAGPGKQQKAKGTPPPPPKPPKQSKEDEAFEALHLCSSAPPEVVKAAYRALAQKHHPDHQGDTATMQRLNQAYDLLSKQVAA